MTRDVAPELARHGRLLWSIGYRMTGSAADADDIVQETFSRALERPPSRPGDVRPWLVQVAVNLARDRLRQRKRDGYRGAWLPALVPDDAEPPSFDDDVRDGPDPEARYSRLESVSFAFLLALEALTPMQRAVLVLRDVFDYSVRETAACLSSTEGAVKVLHHRARRALEAYDAGRVARQPVEHARQALERFLMALQQEDLAALEALLAEDALGLHDGGEFAAAGVPLRGRARVVQAMLGIKRLGAAAVRRWEVRVMNGLPFLVAEQDAPRPQIAPRFALGCDLDGEGRIHRIYVVLASRKLAHVAPIAAG